MVFESFNDSPFNLEDKPGGVLTLLALTLAATSYDKDAGRKMLWRMRQAGEIVSLSRSLYTTANHPCFAPSSNDQSPVPPVPIVPSQGEILVNGLEAPVPDVPNVPSTEENPISDTKAPVPDVPAVPSLEKLSTNGSEAPVPDVRSPEEMPTNGCKALGSSSLCVQPQGRIQARSHSGSLHRSLWPHIASDAAGKNHESSEELSVEHHYRNL